jgi:hypothetical protein
MILGCAIVCVTASARARFSLSRSKWGDQFSADLRVGPDGRLYQLASSPATGVLISRYSLGHA